MMMEYCHLRLAVFTVQNDHVLLSTLHYLTLDACCCKLTVSEARVRFLLKLYWLHNQQVHTVERNAHPLSTFYCEC
jgi:hypothetical protein